MMRQQNGGGDQLARGAARAQFRTAGSAVSQEKWDSCWEPEVTDEQRSSDSDAKAAGDAGSQPGTSQPDSTEL